MDDLVLLAKKQKKPIIKLAYQLSSQIIIMKDLCIKDYIAFYHKK